MFYMMSTSHMSLDYKAILCPKLNNIILNNTGNSLPESMPTSTITNQLYASLPYEVILVFKKKIVNLKMK